MMNEYNPSMINVQIREAAIKRGITTAYQLQKEMGINPGHASKLWKGKIEMIGLRTLDRLCEALDCELTDLLVRVPEKKGSKR